jgi:hypothetical protein
VPFSLTQLFSLLGIMYQYNSLLIFYILYSIFENLETYCNGLQVVGGIQIQVVSIPISNKRNSFSCSLCSWIWKENLQYQGFYVHLKNYITELYLTYLSVVSSISALSAVPPRNIEFTTTPFKLSGIFWKRFANLQKGRSCNSDVWMNVCSILNKWWHDFLYCIRWDKLH